MPELNRSGDERALAGRALEKPAPADHAADHAALAHLAETLVPALVGRLGASGLGEIEIREGGWTVRVRRSAVARKVADRPRHAGHVGPHAPAAPAAPAVTAPAAGAAADHVAASAGARVTPAFAPVVGVFRPGLAIGARVRAGDRIAVVDLLGIAQDVVAPVDGTLVEVHPQAGDGVEYGEEVAIVEADAAMAGPVAAADRED